MIASIAARNQAVDIDQLAAAVKSLKSKKRASAADDSKVASAADDSKASSAADDSKEAQAASAADSVAADITSRLARRRLVRQLSVQSESEARA